MPPSAAIGRKPHLLCKRPAITNQNAIESTPMLKVQDVSARTHPNSLSSGKTKTLQA